MNRRLATRIKDVGTTIFSEMSALAAAHDAVNLGQGFPDFPGPSAIKDAAASAIAADHNQYAPGPGVLLLRQHMARAWKDATGLDAHPGSEVTITAGATEALLCALLAVVEPGDEVIVLEPYYDSYPAQVRMAGGVPVFVRMQPPHWSLPLEAIERAVSPRTRAIMVNTPSNPLGTVASVAELSALAALCVKHDLVAISDEVYDRLVFPPHKHTALATLPGMWERTFTIHSTGKTFSLTGWKVGWVVAPEHLTMGLRAVHQFNTFAVATPLQHGLVAGFERMQHHVGELVAFYTRQRNTLVEGLVRAGFKVTPPQGTYFVMAGYRHLRDVDDLEFCRWLTRQVGVAAIPPSAFFHDQWQCGMVRFCFAKTDETLALAAERLARMPGHVGQR